MSAARPGAATRPGLAAGLAAALLALVGAVAALEPPGPAPEDTPPARPPSLTVPGLESVVDDEQPLAVRLRVRNHGGVDREDLRVVVTVHGQVTTRVALQQSLDEEPVTGVIHALTQDVPSVPAEGARNLQVEQTRDELGLGADGTAVHPVRVALQADGDVIDEVLTAAVVTGESDAAPLEVGVVLPLSGAPAELPSGRVDAERLDALIAPDSPARSLLRALRRHPDAPTTLALDGLALSTVERARGGVDVTTSDGSIRRRPPDSPGGEAAASMLADLEAVAAQPGTDQLPLPYGRADLVALVRHGAADEASRHVGDATGDVERLTQQPPVPRVLWPAAGINATTLATLGLSAETVVLGEDHVSGDNARLTPEPARQLRTGGAGTVQALVPDPWIERALADAAPHHGALTAARVLAEVASVQLERPGVDNRGLLIAPPQATILDGRVVDPLVGGLADADFAELVDLDRLRETGAGDDQPVATLDYAATARLEELPGSYVTALRAARADVGSLASIVTEQRGLIARLDRRLLQSASTAYRDELSAGQALIDGVEGMVGDVEASVAVPDMPPVTLAAEEGTLPVRLRSTADVPLQVRVTLRSAAYEVVGGTSRDVVLPPGQDQLLSFDVRALAPGGTSPVQVRVTDPDEINELAVGAVVVRSAAFSVTGVVVTATAGLFLLFTLWREVARRRGGGSDPPTSTTPRRRRAAATR